MFVIIYCGYEGIDEILWAGVDADIATSKVKEIRCRIKQNARGNHSVTRVSEEDGQEYTIDSRFELPHPWGNMEDPNRVCVQAEDSARDVGFTCCCAALKVGTKKGWLY